MKINQKIFGDNDVRVAGVYNSLGVLHKKLKNFTKAEELFENALKIQKNVFGENHSFVVHTLSLLGSLYLDIANSKKMKKK